MAKRKKITDVGTPPEAKRNKTPPRVEIPFVPMLPPPVPDLITMIEEAIIPEQPEPATGLAPHLAQRLRALLAEKAMRKIDALKLYTPLAIQSYFHASRSRINIVRGSNRSGKTLCAAVEIARAVTGQDPHQKYPKAGRCFAVGKDFNHIGETMWRKLAAWGPGKSPFKIIRDLVTGEYRSYRPWDASDAAREHEARPSPPLIPQRYIADVAWEDKKLQIPQKVYLTTGWEISFFSSLGKPPQGQDIDLWWFDEEIVDPDWFPEMTMRTADRKGRGIWSATPQAGTEVLFDLHERAMKECLSSNPSVREHVLLVMDNPHIGQAEKKAMAEDLGEDERRVRIDGEFAFVSFRVYPEFNTLIHGLEMPDVPTDWTRYMVVDPGHQVCAVLFAAVPPPEHELHPTVLVYDELYLKGCDAVMFAVNVKARTDGQQIQAAIIDPHGSAITDIGSGKNVGQQYADELKAVNFWAAGTGHQFLLGSDDKAAGRLKVHGWLRVQEETNRPRLRVLSGRCENLIEEFKRYVKKRIGGQVIDEPNDRRWNHLMDCLRYLALHDPKWVRPVAQKPRPGPALAAFRAKEARRAKRDGGGFVRLGPGRSTNAF